ncbi:hypothetical protein RRG08_003500 [Elysia crispata]|uniref:Uncharacterized protein n=1 Tax=Elysia crispata TaxID=231223 RepID=A0AAE0Y6D8_9GAST|nr:hypothetical protein RRG08_003500 [Elysia crispata]
MVVIFTSSENPWENRSRCRKFLGKTGRGVENPWENKSECRKFLGCDRQMRKSLKESLQGFTTGKTSKKKPRAVFTTAGPIRDSDLPDTGYLQGSGADNPVLEAGRGAHTTRVLTVVLLTTTRRPYTGILPQRVLKRQKDILVCNSYVNNTENMLRTGVTPGSWASVHCQGQTYLLLVYSLVWQIPVSGLRSAAVLVLMVGIGNRSIRSDGLPASPRAGLFCQETFYSWFAPGAVVTLEERVFSPTIYGGQIMETRFINSERLGLPRGYKCRATYGIPFSGQKATELKTLELRYRLEFCLMNRKGRENSWGLPSPGPVSLLSPASEFC